MAVKYFGTFLLDVKMIALSRRVGRERKGARVTPRFADGQVEMCVVSSSNDLVITSNGNLALEVRASVGASPRPRCV